MSFGESLERFWTLLGASLLAQPASHYIDLETSDNRSDHALVNGSGGLVSLIRIDGARMITTSAWASEAIGRISDELRASLTEQGHTLQFVFNYDPGAAVEQAREVIRPYRESAKAYKLDMDDLLLDWSNAVSRYTAGEACYVAAWTDPKLLPSAELKEAGKDRQTAMKHEQWSAGSQKTQSALDALRDRHEAFIANLVSVLKSAGIDCMAIDQHKTCRIIRRMFDPTATGRSWRACLPGDPPPVRLDWKSDDELMLLYPSLQDQLMPREAISIDRRTVQIGDYLHRPMVMKLPPQQPSVFQKLFGALIQMPFPYRVSIRIAGNGLAGLSFKQSISNLTRLTSRKSKQFNRVMEQLHEAATQGETLVRFQVEFDTWVDTREPKGNLQELSKQASRLTEAVQGWGNCELQEVVGDPLLGASVTIPGVTQGSPAPHAAPPVGEAVKMLPIMRPARVWDHGLPFRTPDGKGLPFASGSEKQNAWIELMVGPLGSGKSVTANAINLCHILYPGLQEIPYLSIIDVGPSSRGLYDLVLESLPPNRRHLVAFKRLRNEPADAINICDTPLGCDEPFPVHKMQLVNFVALLATPINADSPPDGVTGLASRCIERAYRDAKYENQPKQYAPGESDIVERAMSRVGFAPPEDGIAWWGIVRVLFDAGEYAAAEEAQRYAVPTINDIVQISQNEEISRTYMRKEVNGEPLPQFFWTSLTDAIHNYPVLSGVTRTAFGSARVIIFDLDEVAKKGTRTAERQSAVMYMLAFNVATSHFFYQPEDLDRVPEVYQTYHAKHFEQLRSIPKRMFLDEFHRISRNDSVNEIVGGILEMIERESRKWNIHIALASQNIDDFPDTIIDIATTFYILAASLSAADTITKKLKLPQGSELILGRLAAPSKRGNELFSVIYTADGVPVVNRLTQTLGPELLIGLDSNAWTSTVRRRLAGTIGATGARQILARVYPQGVAQELSRRGVDIDHTERGISEEPDQVDKLIDELLQVYRRTLEAA